MGWILGFAVAATVAGSPVSDEQVAHWARPFRSESLAFDFLVRAKWTESEAAERGVIVTDEDARDAAEDAQPRGGLTRRDVIYEAKLVLLTAGIKAQIAEPAAKSVTPEMVKAYVEANPKQLPERRRIRLVRARTRHDAAQAKKRIDNGLTWKTAAKAYGTGGTTTIGPGDEDADLEDAIFKAPRNETTRYRRYVFRVAEILAPRPMPRSQQEAIAWETLASEAQEQALDAFAQAYQAKWRARTTCGPKYASQPVCAAPPIAQEMA